MDFREIIRQQPLLAILRGIPTAQILPFAQALVQGGVRWMEVPLNDPNALSHLTLLRQEMGDDILLGAGTVLTTERAKDALSAGADFLVSPCADADVLRWCKAREIPLLPGVLTPTDVSTCLRYGYDIMKLFPAGDMPPNYIHSLKGPFEHTDYVAFGGVRLDNLPRFLQQGYLAVGISTGLRPAQANSDDYHAITTHVASIMATLNQFRHTGE